MSQTRKLATSEACGRVCSDRRAVRDRDGKKVVFIAFKGKAVEREVHILAQRSGGFLVRWTHWRRRCRDQQRRRS